MRANKKKKRFLNLKTIKENETKEEQEEKKEETASIKEEVPVKNQET
jgi:hypothetical protein